MNITLFPKDKLSEVWFTFSLICFLILIALLLIFYIRMIYRHQNGDKYIKAFLKEYYYHYIFAPFKFDAISGISSDVGGVWKIRANWYTMRIVIVGMNSDFDMKPIDLDMEKIIAHYKSKI